MSYPATASPPEFRTNSLYLAALLFIRGELPLLRVGKAARGGEFVFADVPEGTGKKVELEFLTDDPSVPIKELRHALDVLRDRVRAAGLREVLHASR